MLGSYVSAAYHSTPSGETERFYAGLLAWARVRLPIAVSGSAIEVRHLEAGDDAVLFAFNHGRQPARSRVTINLDRAGYRATDLVSGEAVPSTRDAAGIAVNVSLQPDGVQVLRLQRIAPK